MDIVNRLLYAALGMVGCLAGFEFAHPYLDGLNEGPAGKAALVRPGDASAERRVLVLPQRISAKSHVIEQLAAERMSLFEAAAWFRWLNENPPDCPGEPIDDWPGACPEEKLCRQVIAYVRMEKRRLGGDSLGEDLADRLEMELMQALTSQGTLKLPSVADGTAGE
jgi:hypothetical protein